MASLRDPDRHPYEILVGGSRCCGENHRQAVLLLASTLFLYPLVHYVVQFERATVLSDFLGHCSPGGFMRLWISLAGFANRSCRTRKRKRSDELVPC